MSDTVPIIDVSPLVSNNGDYKQLSEKLRYACHEYGFFYIKNHGIDTQLQNDLERQSNAFFGLPLDQKMEIGMEKGGKAWRGYFPVNGELTSGKPDLKEGLYFGTELDNNHPKVKAGIHLHGANLFPSKVPGLRDTVLTYMRAITQLGHQLMKGLSMSLGLEANFFKQHFTGNPLTLFRIFHYPASHSIIEKEQWGVGEHTDYGVLTILKQDDKGGLQIRTHSQWIDAPYIPNTFVCNIGDMLERMTGGYYRSTPHRVRNISGKSRLSFPFFFDPDFDAPVKPLELKNVQITKDDYKRWDGTSVHKFEGTYGDYILGKVSKVFPDLRNKVS